MALTLAEAHVILKADLSGLSAGLAQAALAGRANRRRAEPRGDVPLADRARRGVPVCRSLAGRNGRSGRSPARCRVGLEAGRPLGLARRSDPGSASRHTPAHHRRRADARRAARPARQAALRRRGSGQCAARRPPWRSDVPNRTAVRSPLGAGRRALAEQLRRRAGPTGVSAAG